MWTKDVFQKYVGIINNRNHYLNLGISRNYDERISSLYETINQDELVASIMEYPSTLNQLYMSKMREFYHLSNSTYILLGSGSESIICLLNQNILRDKKIASVSPNFYRTIDTAMDCVTIESDLNRRELFWDVSYIERECRRKGVNVVWVSNPNSIVGFGYSKKNLVEMLEKNTEVLFLIDETNIDFCRDSEKLTLIHDVDKHKNLVVIRSCSKFFGMPGARVGMLLTSNEKIIKKCELVKPTFPVCGNSLLIGLKAYHNFSLFRSLADEIESVKAFIQKMMENAEGVTIYPSLINTIYLTSDSRDLWNELKEEGILAMKYDESGHYSSVRITIPSDKKIRECMLQKFEAIFCMRRIDDGTFINSQ